MPGAAMPQRAVIDAIRVPASGGRPEALPTDFHAHEKQWLSGVPGRFPHGCQFNS
jgi:hypothetical protein